MAKNFFTSLYFNDSLDSTLITNIIFPVSHKSVVDRLDAVATEEEVKHALGRWSKIRLQVLIVTPTVFYSSCWSTVNASLKDWINSVICGKKSVVQVNNTFISLILKTPHPEVLSQF